MIRHRVVCALLVLALFQAGSAWGQTPTPEISFQASREGEFIFAEARVVLPVSVATAWAVLSDYENYPRFIASMRESKVVTRNADGVVVDQKGSFGFLFFSQDMEVRLLIIEYPQNVIVARGIEGSFRDSFGRYELQPLGGGVRLSYSGRFLPDFFIPPLIGMSVVNFALKKNFTEMVDEILRRAAAAH